jgi:hypothetical protein
MIDKEACLPKGNVAGRANGQSNGEMEVDEEL